MKNYKTTTPKPELFHCILWRFPYFSPPFGMTNRRFGRYSLPRYVLPPIKIEVENGALEDGFSLQMSHFHFYDRWKTSVSAANFPNSSSP